MLKNKKLLALTSAITLLPVLAGVFLWQKLPQSVPIHWNAAGEVDGYGSRGMLLGLFGFLLVMHWLCIGACALDPKSRNLEGKAAALVLWIIPAISLVMGVLVYSAALGKALSVNTVLPVFMGLLFVFIGNYLPKCRRNYTVGIKVPWALENEENWNATHRFAGRIWVAGGLAVMATALLPTVWVMLGVLAFMALAPMLYSYLYYKKHAEN